VRRAGRSVHPPTDRTSQRASPADLDPAGMTFGRPGLVRPTSGRPRRQRRGRLFMLRGAIREQSGPSWASTSQRNTANPSILTESGPLIGHQ
jgi:hypothetical protein